MHLASEKQLVQNEVCLLEIEDDVQFTNVAVVFVHLLDVAMHNLEGDELVVVGSAPGDEEEGCVASVDYLCICNVRVRTSATMWRRL